MQSKWLSDKKVAVKNADMPDDMQRQTIDIVAAALDKFSIERDQAKYIKKEFDRKFDSSWHVVVGRNFGSYVTHEPGKFMYFYLGQLAVLVFKAS